MKLFHSPKLPLKRLNARGISHIAVPLLIVVLAAIGGTYALVASHADSLNKKTGGTPAKAAKPVKSNNGYMVIYSSAGVYNAIEITGQNIPASPVHKCGVAFTSPTSSYIRTWSATSAAKPILKITCTPIDTNQIYEVAFAANKADLAKATPVAIDIDPGTCTLVHSTPELIRKIPAVGATCPGDNTEPDVPTKVAIHMRALPALTSNKKNVSGYVEVSAPGTDLTRLQCTGQIYIQYSLNSVVKGKVYLPLKFVGAKPPTVPNSYCIARFTRLSTSNMSPGTYHMVVIEAGTTYFTAGDASADITIPAPVVKESP